MFIKDFDKVINLDKVRYFSVEYKGEHLWQIIFEFNSEEDCCYSSFYDTQEEALEVFNDIIANYNSGKKIYEIG